MDIQRLKKIEAKVYLGLDLTPDELRIYLDSEKVNVYVGGKIVNV